MELNTGQIQVRDTVSNKKGIIVHIWPPSFSPAIAHVAGAYNAAPTLANCFALIALEDFTLYIQTLDKLIILR